MGVELLPSRLVTGYSEHWTSFLCAYSAVVMYTRAHETLARYEDEQVQNCRRLVSDTCAAAEWWQSECNNENQAWHDHAVQLACLTHTTWPPEPDTT